MTQKEDIQNAVNVMRKGGVILYPTDTVWGIGCDATNAEAVAKVYRIKQRDDSKALICLADSVDRVQRYVRDVPPVAWDLMELAEKPTTVVLDGAVNLAPNLIVLEGALLSLPEGYREHKCQHKWRADGSELPRHRTGDTGSGGLCVLDTPPGAPAAHSEQHHQTD